MQTAPLGRERTPVDGCRRYRPVRYTFDTRMRFLDVDIKEDWDPEIKRQWESNKELARNQILAEFGGVEGERKVADFIAIGPAPWSVVAHHNAFMHQARHSFVAGAYYPSLTAAGALGERILNQLIITMRDDFPKARKVTLPDSFQDWEKAIDILHTDWGALDANLAQDFMKLKMLRNNAVHYSPTLDGADGRTEALDAIVLLQDIIGRLFSPIGEAPRYIENIPGQFFIALDQEADPVVKHFIIPASALVSPRHKWEPSTVSGVVVDDENYHLTYPELSDTEYAEHSQDSSKWPPLSPTG